MLSESGETILILGFNDKIRDCACWTLNYLSQESDTLIDFMRSECKERDQQSACPDFHESSASFWGIFSVVPPFKLREYDNQLVLSSQLVLFNLQI